MATGLRKDDEEIVFSGSSKIKVIESFDDMGLSEDLLRGIYAYGTWSERGVQNAR